MLLYPINGQNRAAMPKRLRGNRLQPLLTPWELLGRVVIDSCQNHVLSENTALLLCPGLFWHSLTAGTEAPCRCLPAPCAGWYSELHAVKNLSVNSYFLVIRFYSYANMHKCVNTVVLVPRMTFSEYGNLSVFTSVWVSDTF